MRCELRLIRLKSKENVMLGFPVNMKLTASILLLLGLTRHTTALRVLLVRHAQSKNNLIAAEVAVKYAGRPVEEMRAEFEARRSHEPELSDLGSVQAEMLGTTLADMFADCSDVPVHCSCMQRTILTAQPLLSKGLKGWKGLIREDLFEVGGSFSTTDGVDIVHEGASGLELQERFPDFDLSENLRDMGSKGWYPQGARETKEEGLLRAKSIVDGLWTTAESQEGSVLSVSVSFSISISHTSLPDHPPPLLSAARLVRQWTLLLWSTAIFLACSCTSSSTFAITIRLHSSTSKFVSTFCPLTPPSFSTPAWAFPATQHSPCSGSIQGGGGPYF